MVHTIWKHVRADPGGALIVGGVLIGLAPYLTVLCWYWLCEGDLLAVAQAMEAIGFTTIRTIGTASQIIGVAAMAAGTVILICSRVRR